MANRILWIIGAMMVWLAIKTAMHIDTNTLQTLLIGGGIGLMSVCADSNKS